MNSSKSVSLPSGAKLRLICQSPPLQAEVARLVDGQVHCFLREEYLRQILLGRFSQEANFQIGTGWVGNQLVATCWAGWGVRRGSGTGPVAVPAPPIAVMGGVTTRQEFQGNGIASALVASICERCDGAGTNVIYLGATNPAARHIYEKLGFLNQVGHVFCRRSPGAPDEQAVLAAGQPVTSADASWADMGAIIPLYLHPHECILVDSLLPFLSTRLGPPSRCVRIFWETWRSVQGGGRWRLLRTESGCAVAGVPARWTGRAFLVDFLWHPHYSRTARDFVVDALQKMESASGAPCEIRIAAEDAWKQREARLLGFASPVDDGVLELSDRHIPLVRLRRSSAGS